MTRATSDHRSGKGVGGGIVPHFRSGLEDALARQLEEAGVEVRFEPYSIRYEVPSRIARYTPDFELPNGIIIESKGVFDAADRQKHLLIKRQYPHLDVRFVFSNARARIYKGSPTTHAAWCEKHGFRWAHRSIPEEWIKERPHNNNHPPTSGR